MKTIHRNGTILFLLLCLLAGFNLQAQQTEEEPARELEFEEEMQSRKKMLQEQEEEMRQMELEFAEQERVRESYRARVGQPGSGVAIEPVFVPTIRTQENHTQLTLRNSFRGGSDSSKGEFEVDEDTRHFRCMINGKVRSGKITIKVDYPNGKTFKELTITSSAEINYTQSLSIKEGDEGGKYRGTWEYSIEADEAQGDYILSISTH